MFRAKEDSLLHFRTDRFLDCDIRVAAASTETKRENLRAPAGGRPQQPHFKPKTRAMTMIVTPTHPRRRRR
jgi:hypothetical protein